MELKLWPFSRSCRLGKNEHGSITRLLVQLLRDEAGSYLVYLTLVVPLLIGVAGLATEGSWWLYVHQTMQNAADSAALSTAAAFSKWLDQCLNANLNCTPSDFTNQATTQANAITSAYCALNGRSNTCFNNGENGVTITATPTQTSGTYAVEVSIAQPQSLLFSVLWLSTSKNISASALAILKNKTAVCILALGPNTNIGSVGKINNLNINVQNCSIFSNSSDPSAISFQGNNNVIAASAIGTAGNWSIEGNAKDTFSPIPITESPAISDPYAGAAKNIWQATCKTNCTPRTTPSCPNASSCPHLSPGVYSGGIDLSSNNATYTMDSGVYYVAGNFNFSGQHINLIGNNVTIVLTGSSSLFENSNNATISITSPTTSTATTACPPGWCAGIAIWAPTSNGTIALANGNSVQPNIAGVIYAPLATVTYGGNTPATACTQIVAYNIFFGGNSASLQGDCKLSGMLLFGRLPALVE